MRAARRRARSTHSLSTTTVPKSGKTSLLTPAKSAGASSQDIYRDLGLPKPEHGTFVDLLSNQSFAAITPKVVLDKLHALRIHGNKAAHGEPATARTAPGFCRKLSI